MKTVYFTETIVSKDESGKIKSEHYGRDVNKEDLQRVLDRLYKCRDLEITNLWQRSIFLSAFLLLCFTGYGYLISKLIDCSTDQNIIRIHFVCFIVAIIAAIVSLLYILMAKSSKKWFEVYEDAITAFENKHYLSLGIPSENIMGEMELNDDKKDNYVFSQKAGDFSPSKINIVIGQVCFLLWKVAMVFHFISFFISWLFALCKNISLQSKQIAEIISIPLGIIIFFIVFYITIKEIKQKCKSSHLSQTKQS